MTQNHLLYPPKPKPGDKVAVLSPSHGAPHLFPAVYELGLRRLRDELDLVPVEYPTTRAKAATPKERADDLHAAFADPQIKAVLATIGGDDQITVLPHLDPEVFRANPKPYFGYSDNTNLLAFLWRAGIVSYQGGSVMVHLGRGGRTHPDTMASLRAALFGSSGGHEEWFDLTSPLAFSDENLDWREEATLTTEPPARPSGGHWTWHNPSPGIIEAPAWGGNLEIIGWLMMVNRAIPEPDEIDGHVLYLETSEEMPTDVEVFRTLRNMGERGLLGRFSAVLMGRPKAWSFEHRFGLEERAAYADKQRAAVLRTMEAYNPSATVVFDVDFGHTDPQLVIPNGGMVRLDAAGRTISVRY